MICCGLTYLHAQQAHRTANAKSQNAHESHGAWLFIYFKEPGSQGIYFALSRDGYHYTPLNDGQPWVAPAQSGELVPDPYPWYPPPGAAEASEAPPADGQHPEHGTPAETTEPGALPAGAPEPTAPEANR